MTVEFIRIILFNLISSFKNGSELRQSDADLSAFVWVISRKIQIEKIQLISNRAWFDLMADSHRS